MAHKQWWKSKTMWINILTVAVAVFSMIPTSFSFSKEVLEFVLFFNAALNICLRYLSGQPIGPATVTPKK